jgi:hypothetical protein
VVAAAIMDIALLLNASITFSHSVCVVFSTIGLVDHDFFFFSDYLKNIYIYSNFSEFI